MKTPIDFPERDDSCGDGVRRARQTPGANRVRVAALLSLAMGALLFLSGCDPEERFWWSPSGDRAAVVISDQLHLVDADGTIGQPLFEKNEGVHFGSLSWLPDGSGFVFARIRLIKTWAETLPLIPAEEATLIGEMRPLVLPLLKGASRLTDADNALRLMLTLGTETKNKIFQAAVRIEHEQAPAGLEKLLEAFPKGAKFLEDLKKDDAGFVVSELCLYAMAKGAAPRVLCSSLLHPFQKPKISPAHAVVAFLKDNDESASLEVLPLEGGSALTVDSRVNASFDWTPDGRSLVFLSPLKHQGQTLQSIRRRTVLLKSGARLKPHDTMQGDGSVAQVAAPDRMAAADTLATGILNGDCIQVLADGRVLFASATANLPAVGDGTKNDPRFYLISADGKSVQPVASAPGGLPSAISGFVASPDGKQIAVVENNTDAVTVVEVATGKAQIISKAHPHWQSCTLPAWKSATELTFVAPRDGAPKWLLWSADKGVRSLSENWPREFTFGWLGREE
jgi:hypothetical protein